MGQGRIILEFKRVMFKVLQWMNLKKKNSKLTVYEREWIIIFFCAYGKLAAAGTSKGKLIAAF